MHSAYRLTTWSAALAWLIWAGAGCSQRGEDDMGASPERGDTTAVAVDTSSTAYDTTVTSGAAPEPDYTAEPEPDHTLSGADDSADVIEVGPREEPTDTALPPPSDPDEP